MESDYYLDHIVKGKNIHFHLNVSSYTLLSIFLTCSFYIFPFLSIFDILLTNYWYIYIYASINLRDLCDF